jgi:hypothetical protein
MEFNLKKFRRIMTSNEDAKAYFQSRNGGLYNAFAHYFKILGLGCPRLSACLKVFWSDEMNGNEGPFLDKLQEWGY